MTDIQIKYWDYIEGARHNLAYETENNRHNTATERQAANELVETNRHNVATEGIQQGALNENIRHDYATEANQRISANASMLSASAAMKNANTQRAEMKSVITKNYAQSTQATMSAYNSLQQGQYWNAKTTGQKLENEVKSASVEYDKAYAPWNSLFDLFNNAIGVASKGAGLAISGAKFGKSK